LIPDFESAANADDDELSWGRADYLQYYPKLSRPTDEYVSLHFNMYIYYV
jgi:hypothetical protein